jgi:hypothetical protein
MRKVLIDALNTVIDTYHIPSANPACLRKGKSSQGISNSWLDADHTAPVLFQANWQPNSNNKNNLSKYSQQVLSHYLCKEGLVFLKIS